MKKPKFISLNVDAISENEMLSRSKKFFRQMDKRRSVRNFSPKPVSKEVMENIVKTASTAPSGANKQPWSFCLVSDPEIKKKIRIAAELEEKENYSNRMSKRWIMDLNVFGTSWKKPFLEVAPWHIVVFKRIYETEEEQKHNNYYVGESVGIATGVLLAAIHNAGLVSLTHTPSPMNFLSKVLKRPPNERAFLLIPVGYPDKNARVPDIKRKTLSEILSYY